MRLAEEVGAGAVAAIRYSCWLRWAAVAGTLPVTSAPTGLDCRIGAMTGAEGCPEYLSRWIERLNQTCCTQTAALRHVDSDM